MPVFYSLLFTLCNTVKVKDNKITVQGDNLAKEIWATRDLISIGFMLCFQPVKVPKEIKFCGKIVKPHDI